jgi:hypothetical protein
VAATTSDGWRLAKPITTDSQLLERLRSGLEGDGQYRVRDGGADWIVDRPAGPPPLVTEMSLRITQYGVIGGTPVDLERQLQSWWDPSKSIGGVPQNQLDAFLVQLEAMTDPTNKPLLVAKANEVAGYALSACPLHRLGEVVSRVAAVYRRWIPNGQLIVWERDPRYMRAERAVHVVASAQLLGVNSAQEAAANNSSSWIHGEHLLQSPIAPLYLDLIPLGTAGVSWQTVPYIFVYEYGDYRRVGPPPLDAVSLWQLHSVSLAEYFGTRPPSRWRVPAPNWLDRDALRSWFVAGINRLAGYVLSLENFRTDGGRLRPDAQQQAYATVARLLNSTALLFASGEPNIQRLAFWDLVDLYAGLRMESVATGVAGILGKPLWDLHVIPGVGTLPGTLGSRWTRLAHARYRRWVRETIAGIIVPSRRRGSWVRVGPDGSEVPIRWHEFFNRHLEARRHTLHGYYPAKPDRFRDYLAIHDGRLAHGLPEWARFMFMGLLANPGSFLAAFSCIPLPGF